MQLELHCHRMLHILCFDLNQFEISSSKRVNNVAKLGFLALEDVWVLYKKVHRLILINRFLIKGLVSSIYVTKSLVQLYFAKSDRSVCHFLSSETQPDGSPAKRSGNDFKTFRRSENLCRF